MLYASEQWIGALVIALAAVGCGGGNEDTVDASKTVSTFELTATAALHTQQLTAAGVTPITVQCYRSLLVSVGPPAVMFVYEIKPSDAVKAETVGFTIGASRANFTPTSVTCTDPVPIQPV